MTNLVHESGISLRVVPNSVAKSSIPKERHRAEAEKGVLVADLISLGTGWVPIITYYG